MTWQPQNLASPEFAHRTPPPDHCGLFYRGRRHVVSGPPESMKTLLAWIGALGVIRVGGRAAHIDFEMGPEATRELLEHLGATPEEIESVYYVEPDCAPDHDDLVAVVDA